MSRPDEDPLQLGKSQAARIREAAAASGVRSDDPMYPLLEALGTVVDALSERQRESDRSMRAAAAAIQETVHDPIASLSRTNFMEKFSHRMSALMVPLVEQETKQRSRVRLVGMLIAAGLFFFTTNAILYYRAYTDASNDYVLYHDSIGAIFQRDPAAMRIWLDLIGRNDIVRWRADCYPNQIQTPRGPYCKNGLLVGPQ